MSCLFSYEQLFRFAFPEWTDPIPVLPKTWNKENMTPSAQDFPLHPDKISNDKNEEIEVPETVTVIIWEIIAKNKYSNLKLSNNPPSLSTSVISTKIHFQIKTKGEIEHQFHDVFPESKLIVHNSNCLHFLPNALWVYSIDPSFSLRQDIQFIDPFIGFWLLDSSKFSSDDLITSIPQFPDGSYNFSQFFNEINTLIYKIQENQLEKWLVSIEMPFLRVLSQIPSISLNINHEIAIDFENSIKNRIKELNKRSFTIAQRQFNLLSPFEVSDITNSLDSSEKRNIIIKSVEENEILNSLLFQIDSLLSLSTIPHSPLLSNSQKQNKHKESNELNKSNVLNQSNQSNVLNQSRISIESNEIKREKMDNIGKFSFITRTFFGELKTKPKIKFNKNAYQSLKQIIQPKDPDNTLIYVHFLDLELRIAAGISQDQQLITLLSNNNNNNKIKEIGSILYEINENDLTKEHIEIIEEELKAVLRGRQICLYKHQYPNQILLKPGIFLKKFPGIKKYAEISISESEENEQVKTISGRLNSFNSKIGTYRFLRDIGEKRKERRKILKNILIGGKWDIIKENIVNIINKLSHFSEKYQQNSNKNKLFSFEVILIQDNGFLLELNVKKDEDIYIKVIELLQKETEETTQRWNWPVPFFVEIIDFNK